jgi:regulatory protein
LQTLKQRTGRAKPIDSVEQAFERALRYLGYRARSGAEVKNYLHQRGGTDAVVDATIEKLRGFNFINDEAFARNWALSRAQNQGYGPGKIEQELRTKGVADGQIDAVVKEIFASETEEARARKVLQKKFGRENFREPRALRRAVAFLERRGYNSKVIFTLLRCPIDDNC